MRWLLTALKQIWQAYWYGKPKIKKVIKIKTLFDDNGHPPRRGE